MRRIVLLGLTLLLPGCSGFGKFVSDTFSTSSNPNTPPGDSENMQRAMGQDPDLPALAPEPGNIWPGPPPPEPTLLNVMEQPSAPGTGVYTGPDAGPGATGLPPAVHPQPRPKTSPAGQSGGQSAAPTPATGSPLGTGQDNGGAYQTLTGPNGGIIVPNGNGTSTVINQDGSVQTVPTPK